MCRDGRGRVWFWSTVAALTLFITLEPALFLVVLAIALSVLVVLSVLLVAQSFLLSIIFTTRQPSSAAAAADMPPSATAPVNRSQATPRHIGNEDRLSAIGRSAGARPVRP